MLKNILPIVFLFSVCVANSQILSTLYKEVNSSVVVINTISVEPQGSGDNIQLVTTEALGSGVLIAKEGLIWTASHVIQSAEVVEVEFLDSDTYEADVLSSNPQADVALIRIRGDFRLKNKKVAVIGDSDKMLIGEDVFVLGAPHGFKQSLSRGIVSGRFTPEHLRNAFVSIEFLQTDAAINPGNSGGPMFNMKGEVVGIASSIYTNSGGFEGIGFVISSNVARKLLMEKDNFWSGMQSVLISGNIAKALNVPQKTGLLVINVSSKGTARELGLVGGYIKATIDGKQLLIGGDIILNVAGITFDDTNSFFQIRKKLDEFKKGENIQITILRNGKIGVAEFKMK
jgi:serine protease Do